MAQPDGNVDWNTFTPEPSDGASFADIPGEPTADYANVADPDPAFLKAKPRARGAKAYETKVSELFSVGFRLAAQNPNTVADAASLLMQGPDIAKAAGDLAVESARFARGIDMITSGAENPYANFALAVAPLVLQVIRNHEPVAEMAPRAIKIPFTKRTIALRFNIKLGAVRNLTNDPHELYYKVFSDAAVADMVTRQGIKVAEPR